MADDDIFNRIQALLRMAEGNANQHEAAVAAEKAAQLIRKYNLDADTVRDWSAAPVVTHASVFLHHYLPESWRKKRDNGNRRFRKYARSWPPMTWYEYGQDEWFVYLSRSVARVCECEAPYYSPGSVTFVGRKDNVEQAAFLMGNIFRRLMLMVDEAIKTYAKEYKVEHGVSPYREMGYCHPAKFRIGYLEGAAYEIGGKLYDIAREKVVDAPRKRTDGQERALVVLETAIDQYKKENFAHANSRTMEEKIADGSARGYNAGSKDGERFTLQSGVGAGVAVAELTGV
jgi:hypothetical protein